MIQEEPPRTMVCLLCGEVCHCQVNDKNCLYDHLELQHDIMKRRKESGDTDDCAINTIFCEKAELLALQRHNTIDSTPTNYNNLNVFSEVSTVISEPTAAPNVNTKNDLETAKEIGFADMEILAPVNKIKKPSFAETAELRQGDETINLDVNSFNINETLSPTTNTMGFQDFGQQYDCSNSTSETSISLNFSTMRFSANCTTPFTINRKKTKRLKFLSFFNFWPFKYFIKLHRKSPCSSCNSI